MSKAVIQPFEEYQKGRIMFVQTVAELANRPKYIDSLKSVGVMKLLGPLLSDPVTSIKQSSALAIGRLAKHSRELANAVVEDDGRIMKQLLESFDNNNKFYKKATCFVISSVARHSVGLAQKVVEYKAIDFLVNCLEEYDPSVKEAAVWALGYIAHHDIKLAKKIVENHNAIDYLMLCLQEPEINIKRITVQTLSHIAKHGNDLTLEINRKENLQIIIYYLFLKDITLKHKICTCLANMASASGQVAFKIISEIQAPQLIDCIKSNDVNVQKSVITLLNEIAKQEESMANIVNTKIDSKILVDFLKRNPGPARLFAIPLVSTMSGYTKDMAESFINADILTPLNECLQEDAFKLNRKKTDKEMDIEREIKSITCKALGNMAKHTSDITNRIAQHDDIPLKLLLIHIFDENPNTLKINAGEALSYIITFCDQLTNIEPLLNFPIENKPSKFEKSTFEIILLKVISRQKDILNDNRSERKEFLKRGTLKRILQLQHKFPNIKDEVISFNDLYSQDIVNFYDEDHAKNLREKFYKENL